MFNAKKTLALILCCCFLWIVITPAVVFAKGHSSGFKSSSGRSSFSSKAHSSTSSPKSAKSDFSTPRSTTPTALAKDYNTGARNYSSDKQSYSTARPSYKGTWNRAEAKNVDQYPSRAPVKIYGSPPYPPYEYHNNYWGHSWLYHQFFHPTYHYTSWNYGYYEPAFFSWFLTLLVLGFVLYLIYRKVKTEKEDS